MELERGVANLDERGARAVQVGRLIRSYREDRVHGGGRLTQERLGELMGEADARYAGGYDHANISHWENGHAMPARRPLIAVGRALRLSDAEMDGILGLAGYEPLSERAETLSGVRRVDARTEDIQRDVRSLEDAAATAATERAETLGGVRRIDARTESIGARTDAIDAKTDALPDIQRGVRILVESAAEPPPDAKTFAKDALRRAAPPGIYAAAVGWALNALGMNGTLVLAAYAAIALAIVGGGAVLRRRRADAVSELFFITLFFILNVSLPLFAITRMDQFGFYALIPWSGSSYFLLLALTAHLALALAASVIFDVLRVRMYSRGGPSRAFARALGTALPPCLFAFFNMLLFVNEGGWVFYLVTLGVSVGAFTAILAFRDDRVELSDWEAKVALAALLAVIIILCAVGAAGTIAAYLSPSPTALPDHNLFTSWEIDWERLGYPPEEFMERQRVGTLIMSISAIAYLATALGGFLLAEVRRQMRRAAANSGRESPSGGGASL